MSLTFLAFSTSIGLLVKTSPGIYCSWLLAELGYDIDYLRVPVTDEKAPKESDCELLVQRCWNPPQDAALVFNCQVRISQL